MSTFIYSKQIDSKLSSDSRLPTCNWSSATYSARTVESL